MSRKYRVIIQIIDQQDRVTCETDDQVITVNDPLEVAEFIRDVGDDWMSGDRDFGCVAEDDEDD